MSPVIKKKHLISHNWRHSRNRTDKTGLELLRETKVHICSSIPGFEDADKFMSSWHLAYSSEHFTYITYFMQPAAYDSSRHEIRWV